MSILHLSISGHRTHISVQQDLCEYFRLSIPRVPARFNLRKLNNSSVLKHYYERYRCLTNGNANDNASGELDTDKFPAGYEGSKDKDQSHQRESLPSNELLKRLKRYGVSGILAYGLLNTAYYLTTFLLVWFYVVPAPGKMGYLAAVQRFLKIMAMVWAGSQVTKLVRAGGALALAPFVDRGLSWFAMNYKFESQGKVRRRNDDGGSLTRCPNATETALPHSIFSTNLASQPPSEYHH